MGFHTYINLVKLYVNYKLRTDRFLPNEIFPLRASIRLTENCNSKCITCNYWKTKWEDKITYSRAISLIKELNMLGVERVRFTGGEPLLYKEFFYILSHIRSSDFKKITVATNGLLLKKYAEKINQSSITNLSISIDGIGKTNDMIRGITGHFDTAFEGIKKINDKNITIMTTLNQYSAGELETLFNICDKNGLLWDFNLLDNRTYFLNGIELDQIWPDSNTTEYILKTIRNNINRNSLRRITKTQINYAEKYLKKQSLEEPPCYLGFTDIDIDSLGNLWSGCYVLPPIGNLLNSNLYEIIKSKKYKNRIKQMLKRQCPGCSCGYEVNISIKRLPTRAFEYYFLKKRK